MGRESQLERLRSAFAGRGSVVVLVGEPGVGKTRTTQELETYARMRGARVLWGRAHEASGAPAFWPWKQVGDSHARFVPPADLAGSLDPSQVNELGRIFPALAGADPGEIIDATSAQFQLFDAFTAFLRAGSELAPLVIVLDDLHWADKPSLLLLQHLARELARMRILVVGTFRDTELSRTHPLSEALAELNREGGSQRVVLRGLSHGEVGSYIRAVAASEPNPVLVNRIYEETEGNPFFLSEVVNLMVQEGTINADSVSDIAIPDGVREAIGRRLNLISEEANELLTVAAVVGREFPFDTLSLLHGRDGDELVRLIDEGLKARVIEELDAPGRYQFTHAQMQETLLSEISTTNRVHLNGRIAEALEERYGDRSESRASRLAQHFYESATLTGKHAAKALHYSTLAAQQAETQSAWAEAGRHYDHCLTLVTTSEDGLEGDDAELLTLLGVCELNMNDQRSAWRSLNRAITIAQERDDPVAMVAATVHAMDVLAPPLRRAALGEAALEALDGLDEPLLEGQVRVRFFSEGMLPNIGQEAQDAHQRRLEEIVDITGDPYLSARLQNAWAFQASNSLAEMVAMVVSSRRRFAELGMASQAAQAGFGASLLTTLTGELDVATGVTQETLEYGERHGMKFSADNAAYMLSGIWLSRGMLDEHDKLAASRANQQWFGDTMQAMRFEMTGQLDRAVECLPDPTGVAAPPSNVAQVHAIRARVLSNAGHADAARKEIAAMQNAVDEMPIHEAGRGNLVVDAGGVKVYVYILNLLDEGFAVVEDDHFREAVRLVFAGETAYVDANHADQVFSQVGGRSQRRAFGGLALATGLTDVAEAFFEESLEWSVAQKAVVEEGRSHQGLAGVAARRGNRPLAMEHLDKAAEIFQRHGLSFYLDQVIAKKLELQGASSTDAQTSIDSVAAAVQTEHPDLANQAAPDGTVTLLFSDIIDSTATNERLGDTAWMALLREHNEVIREQVADNSGYEVKSTGDGFMLAFRSARDGLNCAIGIQRGIASRNGSAEEPVEVRIGLHTGEAVRERGDFFGKHVNLAARVGGSASGGEILVSSLLAQLVGPSGEFELSQRPAMQLKGLDGEYVTHRVEWR